MNPALYKELTFSCKRKIVQIVLEHNIYEKLVLNFDQTSFGFTSQTYTDNGSESVPITNVDGKGEIYPEDFYLSN